MMVVEMVRRYDTK